MKIDEYDSGTLARIKEVCQELFHGNYITEYVFMRNESLKKANDSYSFVMSHFAAIEELLGYSGWQLCHERGAGVLYLSSQYSQAKMILTKTESYLLLSMRLLYDEKKTQASASGEVFVTVQEILEQLTTLGAIDQVNKQEREKSLRTLTGKNIIARISGHLGELDTRLAILPSVVCAISAEKTKTVVAMLTSQKTAQPTESEVDEI